MRKRLVIFGTGEIAQLAHCYFTEQSDYEVIGFTVDRVFLTAHLFCNLPVVAFEEITLRWATNDVDLFIALSYSSLNTVRMEKYFAAKLLGYRLATFLSPKASLSTNVVIGENCFILEDNTLQPFVTIGDNVTLWSGNHIGHHSTIRDHCFISSHVVISGGVEVGEQCFIGVNATLRDHIKIGSKCIIGAGTLILSDTETEGVYVGSATVRSKVPSTRVRKI